jgi:allophanate hydrolase subunit 2
MTPSLEIVRAMGIATVQSLPRRGRMHLAVPPGGALVPALLVIANRRVGHADDRPAFEVQGRVSFRATQDLAYAIDDRREGQLRAGEELVVESGPRRCAYVATGTRLAASAPPSFVDPESITIVAGPDLDAFADDALSILTSGLYRILPASNRVGTRLAGPALPRRADYRERSRPMIQGALEVPRDGQPIVLGPEHPTTGGYPLIAVVTSSDVGRFHSIRLGGSVRFAVS